jgi:hypothetical protein
VAYYSEFNCDENSKAEIIGGVWKLVPSERVTLSPNRPTRKTDHPNLRFDSKGVTLSISGIPFSSTVSSLEPAVVDSSTSSNANNKFSFENSLVDNEQMDQRPLSASLLELVQVQNICISYICLLVHLKTVPFYLLSQSGLNAIYTSKREEESSSINDEADRVAASKAAEDSAKETEKHIELIVQNFKGALTEATVLNASDVS